MFLEVMAPVIVASQQQFGFSHIASPSSAFGKVNGYFNSALLSEYPQNNEIRYISAFCYDTVEVENRLHFAILLEMFQNLAAVYIP